MALIHCLSLINWSPAKSESKAAKRTDGEHDGEGPVIMFKWKKNQLAPDCLGCWQAAGAKQQREKKRKNCDAKCGAAGKTKKKPAAAKVKRRFSQVFAKATASKSAARPGTCKKKAPRRPISDIFAWRVSVPNVGKIGSA